MPVATGVNEAGLRAVVMFLDFFPERWDQDRPGHCFASLTCWLAGEDLDDLMDAAVFAGLSPQYGIRRVAARLLGLDEDQARQILDYRVTDAGYHPTVEELCRRITEVTGVEVDPGRIL